MVPRFETRTSTHLIGQRLTMSLADNRTRELWQKFMAARHAIADPIGPELYSLQRYDSGYFANFLPEATFEKWAAVSVPAGTPAPPGFEELTLPGGLYAVFSYTGPASAGPRVFQFIYGQWLPASNYMLDDRPHFEVLGAKYKNDAPDSEEEIWIPVKDKA